MGGGGLPGLFQASLPPPARGVFTTRAGGVSAAPYDALDLALHVGDDPAAVAENRARLRAALGLPALAFAEQVHGDGVAVVDAPEPDGSGAPAVDALVTDRPGLGLVVLAADCLPVLLSAPGVVAAAHAGRAGLLAGVLARTVERMAALGADPDRTTAVVGPAAGACCYEVPAEMADDAEQRLPGVRAATRAGTPSLDLRRGAELALRAAGVGQVRHVEACTVDDRQLFSYRRDGRTGRHAGVVWLQA